MVLKKFIAPKISVMRPIDMIKRPIFAKPWWPLPKCILKTLSNCLIKNSNLSITKPNMIRDMEVLIHAKKVLSAAI